MTTPTNGTERERGTVQAKVYEIVNPFDAYTMKSDDETAAAVACMLLGQGAYGLTDENGQNCCPFFLFGNKPEDWLREEHNTTIDAVLDGKKDKVVEALRSVLIGGFSSRREVEDALSRMSADQHAGFLATWHDSRRTSMNNIDKRATALADRLAARTTGATP